MHYLHMRNPYVSRLQIGGEVKINKYLSYIAQREMLIRNIFFVCAYAFAILYVANQVLTANPSSMIKLIYASIMIVPVYG
jgi:hypothetical protein